MVDSGGNGTLDRFVLRARRIAAHSLVQDRAELRRHAEGSFSGTLDTSGSMTVVQELPDSEEAFESLAARLRPLTIKSEPIYYAKVLSALDAVAADEDKPRIERLTHAWSAAEIQGTQVQGYSLQQSKMDGSDATGPVSDTQLAAAWLYADLVHADATGPKQAALAFPLTERYAAAVRVFANLATLTLATLELIQTMSDAGRVIITPEALTGDVVIGKTQLVREARGYVADLGAAPPDLRVSPGWPAEWKPFTVTEMRRQNPANRVRVRLRGSDGGDIAAYDSAVIHRDMDAGSGQWHVLVGGCFVFKIGIERESGAVVGGRFDGIHELTGTNELGLAAARLRLQMHEATAVVFGVNDIDLFELSGFQLPHEHHRQDQVLTEVLGDIVAIEQMTGELLSLCATPFTDHHRVLLRRTRLLHEGKLVYSHPGPLKVTRNSADPPQVIHTPASTLDVGGAMVPMLASFLWHPNMISEVVEKIDGVTTFSMTVPEGQRFLEWAPEKLDLRPDSDFSDIASYNLSGIDEVDLGRPADTRTTPDK